MMQGRAGAWFAGLALLAACPAAWAKPDSSLAGSSRLQVELLSAAAHDTQVRQGSPDAQGETPKDDADALGVLVWRVEAQARLAQGTQASAALDGGLKRFVEQSSEDALILQFSGSVLQRVAGPLGLVLMGSAKDRSQAQDRRSYRSLGAGAGLALRGPDGWRCAASGLWRGFRYLPDPDYDNGGLEWALQGGFEGSGWSVQGSARLLRLGFEGVRRTRLGAPDPDGTLRSDRILRAGLDLGWVGSWVFAAQASLQLARSNSSGSGNQRTSLAASASIPLPWEVDLSLRSSLLLVHYDDPSVPPDVEDPTFGVEDEETRSSFGFGLRRPIWGPLELELRYNRYFGLGSTQDYGRNLLLGGLRFGAEL